MINEFILREKRKLTSEFIKYVLVGGLAFATDFAIYGKMLLVFDYPIAATFGFIAGLLINYYLSVYWVFQKREANSIYAFIIFVITGLIGLLLTIVGLWALIKFFNVPELYAKIPVTGFVLIWNFVSRKILLFR